jgi:hypothetical protein
MVLQAILEHKDQLDQLVAQDYPARRVHPVHLEIQEIKELLVLKEPLDLVVLRELLEHLDQLVLQDH